MYQFSAPPSQLPVSDVLAQLHTSAEQGLSGAEAQRRQHQLGANFLPPPPGVPVWRLYLHQFASPLVYLLVGAAGVALLLREYADAIAVFGVVILNSAIGFYQEWRAEHKMAALKKYLAPTAKVWRQGILEQIPATEITVGDIMLLEAGDRVPADGRLLTAQRLTCNEASFTGESVPASKHTQPLKQSSSNTDQDNMVLMGSMVVTGSGRAVVTAIGTETTLGTISKLLTTAHPSASPLTQTISQLSRQLLIATGGLMILVLVLALRAHLPLYQSIEVAISLAVSAVPEGLPVVLTVTLSLSLWRLAKQQSIVRQLDAIETLGSVDVICTDKTGTLTRGEMVATTIELPELSVNVTGQGFIPEGQFLHRTKPISARHSDQLRPALIAALLSTSSRISLRGTGTYQPIGDPTEVALYVAAKKFGLSRKALLAAHQLLVDEPFDQTNRLSARVYHHGQQYLTIVKGSPEAVAPLLPAKIRRWQTDSAQQLAQRGNRVISLAWHLGKTDPRSAFKRSPEYWPQLSQVATFGLTDPPRTETAAAIAECHRAGIRVIMVTGDHALTAQNVARQVGLADEPLLLGADAQAQSDNTLSNNIETTSLFARASSDLKMRLVTLLQAQGQIVAMTGDGVNDGPALKQADAGVAMGRTGSDVAISVADVVLTNDSFASLVAAIREGRVIWHNLRKVIFYLLSTSLAEVIMVVTSLIAGLPLPLLPSQILWINLVTDGFLDMGLANEKAEQDVMAQPPRGRRQPLIDRVFLRRLIILGLVMGLTGVAFFWFDLRMELAVARTMVLVNLAALQWLNVWNARSERAYIWQLPWHKNWALVGSLVICVSLQVLAVYWPPLQWLLKTTPLGWTEWAAAIGCAVTVLIADTLWKWWQRRSSTKLV